MRQMFARSTGLRRFANAVDDLAPDTVIPSVTGTNIELPLDITKRNRHVIILDDIVLSGTDTINFELRRKSDGVWEQGATAYRWANIVQSSSNLPTNRANWIWDLFPVGLDPVNGVMFLTGASLAVPTSMVMRGWNNGGSQTSTGIMNNEDLHDRARLIINGAASFSSGSVYMARIQ